MSGSLLRNPAFVRLWAAESVSVLGSQVTLLALPLVAATTLRVSALEFGLLSTAEMLPFLLLTLPAGVWVDRLRRRPVMVAADLGRAAALATIPLAFVLGTLTIWQLYAVGFIASSLTVLFDVAYQSYLPSVVERDQLVEGNAKLEISRSAAQILGPGMAGALIGIARAPFAIVVDVASFLWSAALLLAIRRAEPAPASTGATEHGGRSSLRRDVASGLRHVARHGWLRAIAATAAIANLFGSLSASILILYLARDRHLTPEAIGLALSVGSTGVLLAALATSRLTGRLGVGRVLALSSLGFSLASLPIPLAPDPVILPAVAASTFLYGLCGVAWGITGVSLRQAITPSEMRGRVNATMRFIGWGTTPVGAIAGGALGSLLGLRETLVVGAVGASIAFLPVALSSVRSVVAMPEPLDGAVGATGASSAPGPAGGS